MTRRAGFLLSFAAIIAGGFFIFSAFAQADISPDNIIIVTQIQTAGSNADDEFIELYNPNMFPVDITDWKLTKMTASGTESNLVGKLPTSTIKAHGYYLITSHDYSGTTPFDQKYTYASYYISDNYTVSLYDNNGNMIDRVGFGTATNYEGAPATNPDKGSALQRIFDESGYQNTYDNSSDFTTSTPNPHNSQSTIFPYFNSTPTASIQAGSEVIINDEAYFNAGNSTDTDGVIVSYFWEFGDGATSTGVTTTHAYVATGTYDVILTVTDNNDATSSDSLIVTVIENASSTPETEEEETDPTTTTPPYLAQPGDIVINEFLPSPSEGKEWVELYNRTAEEIDLAGWTVSDAVSPIDLSGRVSPNGFFTIEFSTGKLNNSGDMIIIKNSSGTIIHQVAYGDYGGAAAPGKDYSIALAHDGELLSGYQETVTPTKGSDNLITPKPQPIATYSAIEKKIALPKEATSTEATTTPTSTPEFASNIIINEILPNPSADEKLFEFIELKNAGTSTADLSGWIIADKSGKKFKLATTTPEVLPGGLLIVYRASSSIALNNSGEEEVLLYQPDGTLLDQVGYLGPAKKDYSWSRNDDGEFYWTPMPTPGKNNSFPIEDDDISQPTASKTKASSVSTRKPAATKAVTITKTDLAGIRNLAVGAKITTEGTVAVLPGVLGTQILYIVDGNTGIQVYCNKKDFPELAIGQRIKVAGELSQASGEMRIKMSTRNDIAVVSSGDQPIPTAVSNAQAMEMTGSLVRIKGTVLQVQGSYLYVDDGQDELRIYLKPSTGLSAKDLNLKEGDVVEITGIVSLSSSGPRLLPRTADDIAKTGEVKSGYEEADAEPAPTPGQSADNNRYFWIIIAFLAAIIVIMAVKKSPANRG